MDSGARSPWRGGRGPCTNDAELKGETHRRERESEREREIEREKVREGGREGEREKARQREKACPPSTPMSRPVKGRDMDVSLPPTQHPWCGDLPHLSKLPGRYMGVEGGCLAAGETAIESKIYETRANPGPGAHDLPPSKVERYFT